MKTPLTENNFNLFAFRHYRNPQGIEVEEFYEDLQRFKHVRKLINRAIQGDVQTRLLLNHFIVLFNMFDPDALKKMLEFKFTQTREWEIIKPFLLKISMIKPNEYKDIVNDSLCIQGIREL